MSGACFAMMIYMHVLSLCRGSLRMVNLYSRPTACWHRISQPLPCRNPASRLGSSCCFCRCSCSHIGVASNAAGHRTSAERRPGNVSCTCGIDKFANGECCAAMPPPRNAPPRLTHSHCTGLTLRGKTKRPSHKQYIIYILKQGKRNPIRPRNAHTPTAGIQFQCGNLLLKHNLAMICMDVIAGGTIK